MTDLFYIDMIIDNTKLINALDLFVVFQRPQLITSGTPGMKFSARILLVYITGNRIHVAAES